MRLSVLRALTLGLGLLLSGCSDLPGPRSDDGTETAAALSPAARPAQPPTLFDPAFRDASARAHGAEIAALTAALTALGPDVDAGEAARAARAVYTYVDQLVVEYEITDGPLIHNTKVNRGLKPRGLCWHWAQDLDQRLQMEAFRTLDIHRAIANHDTLLLEHSTTILSALGQSLQDGILLDPWRKGGTLVWKPVREDRRYNWTPRAEALAYKWARKKS